MSEYDQMIDEATREYWAEQDWEIEAERECMEGGE